MYLGMLPPYTSTPWTSSGVTKLSKKYFLNLIFYFSTIVYVVQHIVSHSFHLISNRPIIVYNVQFIHILGIHKHVFHFRAFGSQLNVHAQVFNTVIAFAFSNTFANNNTSSMFSKKHCSYIGKFYNAFWLYKLIYHLFQFIDS